MPVTAAQYHEKTSYRRGQMSGHFLDWANQPSVFKSYEGIDRIPLPKDVSLPDLRLSVLLRETPGQREVFPSVNIRDLSRILLLSHALTARARHGGGEFTYRSAASAGALYPVEVYVESRAVDGLADGLHYFSPADHSLSRLRDGAETEAAVGREGVEDAPPSRIAFFLSAVFFRSSWKYRERAYRYHLLDAGHLAENLLLALRSMGWPFRLACDFHDRRMNRFLGLDEHREACLAAVRVPGEGESGGFENTTFPVEPPERLRAASRSAASETDYPLIRDMHNSSALSEPPSKTRGSAPDLPHVAEATQWRAFAPPRDWPEVSGYSESVFRRRSRRNFVPSLIPAEHAAALLEGLCSFRPKSGESSATLSPLSVGFVSARLEGFPPGFYLLDRKTLSYGLAAEGDFLKEMTRACLDQGWLANAAAHFVFLSNPADLDSLFGPRGYRYAMLEAGRMGQRLYLMATALGLGCCGIGAFYDEEAARILGLQPRARLLYLVAVGPVKSY